MTPNTACFDRFSAFGPVRRRIWSCFRPSARSAGFEPRVRKNAVFRVDPERHTRKPRNGSWRPSGVPSLKGLGGRSGAKVTVFEIGDKQL